MTRSRTKISALSERQFYIFGTSDIFRVQRLLLATANMRCKTQAEPPNDLLSAAIQTTGVRSDLIGPSPGITSLIQVFVFLRFFWFFFVFLSLFLDNLTHASCIAGAVWAVLGAI